MAWYADLTPCDYFGADFAPVLQAVGWLEREFAYPTGPVTENVFAKLVELCKTAWQPIAAMGVHECTLCQYVGEAQGVKNLFLPGDGVIYVCPELIAHHMNAHHYAPPAEFCRAVLSSPPMNSVEYRKLLLANGGRVLLQLSRG